MIYFDGKTVSVDKEKHKESGVKVFKVTLTENGEVAVTEIQRFPEACSWMNKKIKK
jgi:hypothetical protein